MTSPERIIEKKFKAAVVNLGGKSFKWTSPGLNGALDQITVFPGVPLAFVECKAPGERLDEHQVVMADFLIRCGHRVHLLDNLEHCILLAQSIKDNSPWGFHNR